ncbi:Protein of unknown function, partial [Gryllus bimaculatus]
GAGLAPPPSHVRGHLLPHRLRDGRGRGGAFPRRRRRNRRCPSLPQAPHYSLKAPAERASFPNQDDVPACAAHDAGGARVLSGRVRGVRARQGPGNCCDVGVGRGERNVGWRTNGKSMGRFLSGCVCI